jgi:hypothetical protein
MTVLGEDDRTDLMDGMFLRRLVEGSPLTEHQLQTAIVQDMAEIARRFSTFDFEAYVGCGVEDFLTVMEEFELISSEKGVAEGEEDPPTVYSRGCKADEFIAGLTEEMGWMVEDLPMSTRGIFDSLKSRPGRKETMSAHDYYNKHHGGDTEEGTKKLIEETRKHDPKDHQLKAGRAKGS